MVTLPRSLGAMLKLNVTSLYERVETKNKFVVRLTESERKFVRVVRVEDVTGSRVFLSIVFKNQVGLSRDVGIVRYGNWRSFAQGSN